jgi:hypothetical protein
MSGRIKTGKNGTCSICGKVLSIQSNGTIYRHYFTLKIAEHRYKDVECVGSKTTNYVLLDKEITSYEKKKIRESLLA